MVSGERSLAAHGHRSSNVSGTPVARGPLVPGSSKPYDGMVTGTSPVASRKCTTVLQKLGAVLSNHDAHRRRDRCLPLK